MKPCRLTKVSQVFPFMTLVGGQTVRQVDFDFTSSTVRITCGDHRTVKKDEYWTSEWSDLVTIEHDAASYVGVWYSPPTRDEMDAALAELVATELELR